MYKANTRQLKLTAVILMTALCACSQAESAVEETEQTDFSAPYINITQYYYTTTVGKPIDFSYISGYDDVDGLLPTTVRGYINYDEPGEYYPSIVCTDLSGNEASAVITVHVVESSEVPTVVSATPTPAPTPSTCDSPDAIDANSPCKVVISETLEGYRTIYQGEEGRDACEAEVTRTHSGICEEITTNDGSFWGCGYKEDTDTQ